MLLDVFWKRNALHILQWHITNSCNLRCKHCYQDDYTQNMNYNEATEWLRQYDDYLKEQKMTGQINLTGGEPLMCPFLLDLIGEIRKRHHGFALLTNGTMIDAAYSKRLAAFKPVFVQVSIDGDEATHNKIRGQGQFQKTIEGIKNLKHSGIRVLVSYTVQKSNVGCIEEAVRICNDLGIDKFWWDRVVSSDTETLSLSTQEFKKTVELMQILREQYKEPDGISFVTNSRSLQSLDCSSCYRCAAGQKNLAVWLPNGDVMPCRRLPVVLGNLHYTDFKSIYESKMMDEIIRHPFPKECIGCKRLVQCNGGAKCVTYAQTGNMYARDVNCFY